MNRAKAAFYKDNDSITTIDSLTSNKKSTNLASVSVKGRAVVYNQVSAIPLSTNQITQAPENDRREEMLVASSITIESLLLRQSKIDTLIDRVDEILSQILAYL